MVAASSLPPVLDLRHVRQRRFTSEEVLRMVEVGVLREDEPFELLSGVLVAVTPQGPEHSSAATVLHHLLLSLYEGNQVVVREDKALLIATDSMPEPEVAVLRGAYATFARRHPRGDEALLVVEIAKTTLGVDRAKASLYASSGVPTYWLVDVESKRVEVHTEPLPDGRYALTRVVGAGEPLALPDTNKTLRLSDFLL